MHEAMCRPIKADKINRNCAKVRIRKGIFLNILSFFMLKEILENVLEYLSEQKLAIIGN